MKRNRNIFLSLVISLLILTTLSGCKNSSEDNIAVIDDNGESLTFDIIPERVVILESSIAEIYALSGGSFVGISNDYEEYGLDIGTASIIGSAHYPTLESIVGLNPDLVIYSIKKISHISIAETLKANGFRTYGCKIESFPDYLRTLKQFTSLTNRSDLYEEYGVNVQNKIEKIKSQAVLETHSPKVLFIRAMSTKYSTIGKDNFVVDILNDLGTINIAGSSTITDQLSNEVIISENPEFVFYTFMGNSNVAKSTEYLENNLFSKDFFKNLDAYKNDNVYYLDTKYYHYKPNANWAYAYENLYNIIYK